MGTGAAGSLLEFGGISSYGGLMAATPRLLPGHCLEAKPAPATIIRSGPVLHAQSTLFKGRNQVHFVYIDDSGDEQVRAYAAITIAETDWKDVLGRIKQYRRDLKAQYGIFVTKELHATDFVAGRGNIGTRVVPKGLRVQIFRDTLRMVSSLPGVRLFNAIAPKAQEALIFERLMNRINKNMERSGSNAIIIHDEGKDYTGLVRKMCVYNPIQSQYGFWPDGSVFKNIPLDHILEDIVFRNSADSYFIQLADFCAFALFRCEYPLASKQKYHLEAAFEELHGICIPQCYKADPKHLGIIRGK